jgi:hypothetical protein
MAHVIKMGRVTLNFLTNEEARQKYGQSMVFVSNTAPSSGKPSSGKPKSPQKKKAKLSKAGHDSRAKKATAPTKRMRERSSLEARPAASVDPIMEELKLLKLPVTRENYLMLMLDDVPEGPLDPEIEAQLPPRLRL